MSTPTHTSTYPLWKHMHDEHRLFLTELELGEIIEASMMCLEPKESTERSNSKDDKLAAKEVEG